MATQSPLYQRRRDPTPAELAGIPWLRALEPRERGRAEAEVKIGRAHV